MAMQNVPTTNSTVSGPQNVSVRRKARQGTRPGETHGLPTSSPSTSTP